MEGGSSGKGGGIEFEFKQLESGLVHFQIYKFTRALPLTGGSSRWSSTKIELKTPEI